MNKENSFTMQQSQSVEIPLQALVKEAKQAFTDGRLEDVRQISAQIVRRSPTNEDGNHLLGLVEFHAGNLLAANTYLEKAVRRNPGDLHIYCNYAKLLIQMGRTDEARKQLKLALKQDGEFNDALNALGNLSLNEGKYEEAKAYYSRATGTGSDDIESLNGLFFAFYKLGDTDSATNGFINLLKNNNRYIPAYINLATIYKEDQQYEKAIEILDKANLVKPYDAEISNLLGVLLVETGKEEEGLSYIKQAIDLEPEFTSPYYNLYEVLERKNDIEQLFSYAYRIRKMTQWSELKCYAAKIFGRGAAIDERDEISREIIVYARSHQPACKDIYQFLLLVNYLDNIDRDTIYFLHSCWAKERFQNIKLFSHRERKNRMAEGKLRIGYLSGDFRRHSVGYFIQNILKAHSKKDFETYCYYNFHYDDEITESIRFNVDEFRNVSGKSVNEISRIIYEDKIDILIDLAGQTSLTIMEVMARKPAPIQVTYLGYPNTTGLSQIDYRITDKYADVIDGTLYTEEKIELPDCFLSFGELADVEIQQLSAFERNGYITFGSFNNIQKLNKSVVKTWSAILTEVPHSKLLMKESSIEKDFVKEKLLGLFSEYGINEDQLIFAGRQKSTKDHLSYYNNIDIALDPFPYNGTTTTCEALWMGVPVVTLVGKLHAQRVSYSILKNIGVESTIAETNEQYIHMAKQLSKNESLRTEMRTNLRNLLKNSILCDTSKFTEQLEEKYRFMSKRYLTSVM